MIPSSLKNISEFPRAIQPVLIDFAHQLLKILDDNIVSISVYGSAAGVNYDHDVSNINICVVLKTLDFALLKQSTALVKSFRRQKMATPLFLTRDYVLNSLDVFPIEFSEIKDHHKVIFGDDIFKDVEIPSKDVRLLCEQQVKGKLLHLRQAYLEVGANAGVIKGLLIAALRDLMPIFRQLINLKGEKPPEQNEQMLETLARIFSLDSGPLVAVYQDKHKKNLISSHQVEAHLQNFLSQLEKLSRHMDAL